MQTRVSSKGQVVLPAPIRRKLGLRPGDELEACVKGGKVVMIPLRTRTVTSSLRKDSVTGLPVLSAGPGAPPLTSEQVLESLGQLSMRYLLDVNALIALGFLEHTFHGRVASWVRGLAGTASSELLTCSITELGFVRVLSQAPQYGFTVLRARAVMLRLRKSKTIRFGFIADDHDVSRLPSWETTAKRTIDGHLAELARAHEAVLATMEKEFPERT
jgi:AbrB family looped-hinge helix DNA binding protein